MEPHAAVTVIVGPQPAVLLIRRPIRATDPWSGQWALPGGRRQTSDATLLDTARRELAEEVGLHLSEGDWTALPTQVAGRHSGLSVPVAPYLCHLAHIPDVIADPREVAATHWLSLTYFDDPAQHHVGTVPGGGDREWPHCLVDGQPLWGFTYRVLTTWRNTRSA